MKELQNVFQRISFKYEALSEKQLNEVETDNPPEKAFRMIVKMTQDLGKTMEKMQMFTNDLQELKNKQR